ncbi:IclR family transcriptional regulator [Bradyrhizobium genosp. A]|uniref:IclR family transcriptional regulator n=1 Tax=Bradyrhizobium genosp. A TaxID=83626 RepID=UPI003CF25FE5
MQQRGKRTRKLQNSASKRDRYLIEAVDRALNLLELLGDNPGLGVTEIADRMGVSKALAFRLLHTLQLRDYVIRDAEKRTNELGFRLLHLASQVDQTNLIVSATRDHMDDLARLSREDVNLFVRAELSGVCVATRPSAHQVRMFAHLGVRTALYVGGASTVLLAYAPEDVQNAVLASKLHMLTPQTLIEPLALRQRLEKVRASGFYLSCGDVDPLGFSVAAPVWGHGAVVVAAISLAGTINRLTPETEAHYRGLVIDYAGRMSRLLGGG